MPAASKDSHNTCTTPHIAWLSSRPCAVGNCAVGPKPPPEDTVKDVLCLEIVAGTSWDAPALSWWWWARHVVEGEPTFGADIRRTLDLVSLRASSTTRAGLCSVVHSCRTIPSPSPRVAPVSSTVLPARERPVPLLALARREQRRVRLAQHTLLDMPQKPVRVHLINLD